MKTLLRLHVVCVAAVGAAASARPTISVQPVFDLENETVLNVGVSTFTNEAARFEQPGRWISRPPAALQQPIPVPPVRPDVVRRGGGPAFGIGEPGFHTEPPPRPGGGDPNGPGGPNPVPLPTGFGLGVSGLLAIAGVGRRRRA